MYPFSTRPDRIPLEAVVALACASGSQELNGHSALFSASPTEKNPSVTVSGNAYSPLAASARIPVPIGSISRWPVMLYRITTPIRNRPEPSRLMIM